MLVVKTLPASAGGERDVLSFPGLEKSPGRAHGNPLQYSCLENPQGQRSLAGHSPWSHKESDTTEATWHAYTHAPVKKMVPLQNHQLSFLLDILIYIYTYLKNWLTWLWRLGSPKDLYSKGLRPRRGSGISSSPSLRAKGDWCPSSKTSRKRMNSSLFRFYLGLRWTEWTSLKFGVKSALLSLQIQKLISSRNTFIDTPRIMFNQVSGPCGTVKLTNKINHHNLPPEKTKKNLSPLTSTSSSITLPFHSLSQWNFSEDLCLSTMLPSSEACPLSRPMKCQTLPQCPYST